jgi:hypothetical protein
MARFVAGADYHVARKPSYSAFSSPSCRQRLVSASWERMVSAFSPFVLRDFLDSLLNGFIVGGQVQKEGCTKFEIPSPFTVFASNRAGKARRTLFSLIFMGISLIR